MVVEEYLDVKPKSRPFKRCFKNPAHTISKLIFNFISDVQFGRKSIREEHPYKVYKASNSRGSKQVRYASIKGYCKLRRNGLLI